MCLILLSMEKSDLNPEEIFKAYSLISGETVSKLGHSANDIPGRKIKVSEIKSNIFSRIY